MILPGMVSVTFRSLDPSSILDLCEQAGLSAIEWGGDVHVPADDLDRAKQVGNESRARGLTTLSYGSYYRLGNDPGSFETILKTAVALGVSSIRVWAGSISSNEALEQHRGEIYRDLERVSKLTHSEGLSISIEHHGGTLADSADSALQFPAFPNVFLDWQPNTHVSPEIREQELARILPRLSHVHVFHWMKGSDGREIRQSLCVGEPEWRPYLQLLRNSPQVHGTLLEFVENDSPEQFLADAATLNRWIGELSPHAS